MKSKEGKENGLTSKFKNNLTSFKTLRGLIGAGNAPLHDMSNYCV